ncbi:hypothetical protein [Bdellovibrio sp. BCCA]|uniref:hypothetical protein n=1 Tax=Bdellovibrio sp. BCCA TaxID=3136281 RepID=UPI0030F17F72
MKTLKIALAVGVVGIGGAMMFMASSGNKTEIKENKNPTVTTGTPDKRVPVLPTMDTRPEFVTEQGSIPDSENETMTASAAPVWQNFIYKSELAEYRQLHAKIFLTDEEKTFRKGLVKNEQVLRSLQEFLQTPATDDSSTQMQNAALDLLFEALQTSADGEAARVLKAVVSNPTVEDKSVNLETRKSLAGIKAEILFQMSSMHPQTAQELERLLPGPVSQQLWSNVKAQQQNNLAESSLQKGK